MPQNNNPISKGSNSETQIGNGSTSGRLSEAAQRNLHAIDNSGKSCDGTDSGGLDEDSESESDAGEGIQPRFRELAPRPDGKERNPEDFYSYQKNLSVINMFSPSEAYYYYDNIPGSLIKCSGCSRAYKHSTRIDTLMKHLAKKHNLILSRRLVPDRPKPFLVPVCNLPRSTASVSDATPSQIEEAVVRWILEDSLTLSAIETSAFLKFIRLVAPNTALPSLPRLRDLFNSMLTTASMRKDPINRSIPQYSNSRPAHSAPAPSRPFSAAPASKRVSALTSAPECVFVSVPAPNDTFVPSPATKRVSAFKSVSAFNRFVTPVSKPVPKRGSVPTAAAPASKRATAPTSVASASKRATAPTSVAPASKRATAPTSVAPASKRATASASKHATVSASKRATASASKSGSASAPNAPASKRGSAPASKRATAPKRGPAPASKPVSAPAPIASAPNPVSAPAPVASAPNPVSAPAPVASASNPAPAPVASASNPVSVPASVTPAPNPVSAPAPVASAANPVSAPIPVASAPNPASESAPAVPAPNPVSAPAPVTSVPNSASESAPVASAPFSEPASVAPVSEPAPVVSVPISEPTLAVSSPIPEPTLAVSSPIPEPTEPVEEEAAPDSVSESAPVAATPKRVSKRVTASKRVSAPASDNLANRPKRKTRSSTSHK